MNKKEIGQAVIILGIAALMSFGASWLPKKEETVVGLAIKNRWTGEIIFQSTKTTYKEAVAEVLSHNVNLRDANLSDSNLRNADLRDSDLSNANLRGVNLSGADLSGANLSGVNLRDSDLVNANLRDSDLSDSNLIDSDLSDSNLSDSDLSGVNLSGANLSGAEMQNAKFYGRGGTKELKKSQITDFLAALGFVVVD